MQKSELKCKLISICCISKRFVTWDYWGREKKHFQTGSGHETQNTPSVKQLVSKFSVSFIISVTVLCNICIKIICVILNSIDKVLLSVLPPALPAVPCGYSVRSAWNGEASFPIITTTFLRSGTAAKTPIVVTGVSQASGLWLSQCPLFTPSSVCGTTCLSATAALLTFQRCQLRMSLNASKGRNVCRAGTWTCAWATVDSC